MPKHGKKYLAALDGTSEVPRSAVDAVALVKSLATAKFDETVELHISTSADPRQADQQIREVAPLPHGTGKVTRVVVFAEGETARAAEAAGADYVADEEIIAKIEDGWTDFDVSIATPDQMAKIGRLGRFLGRKGLMPNPRTGTVVQADDIATAIEDMKKGRTEIRMDRDANIHVLVGKVSFSEEQLLENLESVVGTMVRAKPSGLKGQLVRSATLTSTMGPPVKLVIDETGGGTEN
jgi:large subunit ribosomal protein L1|tara:strand:+ start:623 stop:1333 length:711 start_codon:yes stop_codon:yes gene_type:complete